MSVITLTPLHHRNSTRWLLCLQQLRFDRLKKSCFTAAYRLRNCPDNLRPQPQDIVEIMESYHRMKENRSHREALATVIAVNGKRIDILWLTDENYTQLEHKISL